MSVELTNDLGRFVSELRYEDIPKDGLSVIHTGFADCVGVMLAGGKEEAPQLLRKMLAPAGGEATILFGEGRASALDAAWINGTAAHALDYDDVAMRSHPSAVMVPAILAEAEALGSSGRAMVLAYAAGYEAWAELVRRDVDPQHKKGWHPTGIFGSIGAAAACASLRRLDPERTAHAIAIGASQSAGLISNFGTMTKPFHAGKSAHAGVAAARLAEIGFTGSLDALEHPLGFLTGVSLAGRIDLESPVEAGRPWKLTRDRISIKKYPMCFCAHRALDGMLDLLEAERVDAKQVKKVTVSISRRAANMLRKHAPQNGLEAKFSMEFAMASAVVARRASSLELSDDFVRRKDVQDMMRKVVITPDDNENTLGFALFDRVTVDTTDGQQLDSGRLTSVRGGAAAPLEHNELWQKFEGCVQSSRRPIAARPLFDALMALDAVGGAAELNALARYPTSGMNEQ